MRNKMTNIIKLTLLVLFIALMGTIMMAFAGEKYPLKEGEVVIEEASVDKDRAVIYTQIDSEYYMKEFRKQDSEWILEKEKKIQPKATGLMPDKTKKGKDVQLANALKNKLKAKGFATNSVPQKVDYSNSAYLPPVGDQHRSSSCVGWAAGYYLRTYQQAMDMDWNVKNGDNPVQNHVFSPSFIYNQINGGKDKGAPIDAAGDLLVEEGAASLADFPYVWYDYLTQPADEIMKRAFPNKIRRWRVLYGAADGAEDIVSLTKAYLNTGDLVVAGGRVGPKFYDAPKDGNGNSVITVEANPDANHAYVVVGYDDNYSTGDGLGVFKIVSSWGKEWGNGGFSYITYKAFADSAIAGYVFTDFDNLTSDDKVQNVNAYVLSPTEIKLTWDVMEEAEEYRIMDEDSNVLSTVSKNEYIEELDEPGKVTRQIQPINEISTGGAITVTIDSNEYTDEKLQVITDDMVIFPITLKGRGKYDFIVYNNSGDIVYEERNLYGTEGVEVITWDGRDKSEKAVPDGYYKARIIPYKNGQPRTPTDYEFYKEGKVMNTSAEFNKAGNEIISMKIPVTAKSDGKVSISVYFDNGSKLVDVIRDEDIKAGETVTYEIDKDTFDFNSDEYQNPIVIVTIL